MSRLSGWMTSVTSVAVPPVERFAVLRRYTTCPAGGTEPACSPARASICSACASSSSRVRTFSWPTPRRGSWFTMSISWTIVCVPSPTTCPGRAPGRRDQLAVDDQQPVIVALEKGLDDHRARMLARRDETRRDLLVGGEPDRDAAAVIAVVGLGDHRVADASRGAHRLRFVLHELLARHRQAERGQDLVGLLLVARELDRDVRRASADGRLDALLVLAVTELHQRLVVQAQPRDLARFAPRAPARRWTDRARAAARNG